MPDRRFPDRPSRAEARRVTVTGMKRALAAALIFAASALGAARADEGAYGSLVGMEKSAARERAAASDAEAESDPQDDRMREALKDAVAQTPAPRSGRSQAPRADDPGAAVAPPPSPGPRIWTRLYSALLPSWNRTPSSAREEFDAPSSTAAVRARPARVPAPDAAAVAAGERRGLAELFSSPAAPTDPR